jgi:serine/threonine protein phosphatase PrpC
MNSGDVPRVDGQLAVARAFGDKSLKEHLSSEPDVAMEMIDDDTDCIILASDGLWKVYFTWNFLPLIFVGRINYLFALFMD